MEKNNPPPVAVPVKRSGWVVARNPLVDNGLNAEQRRAEEEREVIRIAIIAEKERQERSKRETLELFVSTKYNVLQFPEDLLFQIFSFLDKKDRSRLSIVCKKFCNLQKYPLEHGNGMHKKEKRSQSIIPAILRKGSKIFGKDVPKNQQQQSEKDKRKFEKEEKKEQKELDKKEQKELKEKEKKERKDKESQLKEILKQVTGSSDFVITRHAVISPPPGQTSGPQIPPPNPISIAYCGSISRVQSEEILKGHPDGTFLTRWSNNTKSYVLSVIRGGIVQHVSGLAPGSSGQISVIKENGSIAVFPSLNAYIERMKTLSIISLPIPENLLQTTYHTCTIIDES